MYAHFFIGGKRRPNELILTKTPALNVDVIETLHPANNRDARAIAKARGATPHNF